MSALKKYSYTQDQVTAAFDEIILSLFKGITAEDTPKMLVVAGLQSSGKTYLLEKTLLPSKRYGNYVRLYLPEYRKKHPQYAQMIEQGVLHAYEHTETFVREVSKKIHTQALANKYNIIMECAFDSLDFATFPPIATAAGYQFETHIVGCTQEFAHVSSIKRALKSLDDEEMERFLTVSALNTSLGYAPSIILALETAAKAVSGSSISLYERGFGALKERTLKAQNTYSKAADGKLTKSTSKVDFSHRIYADIADNAVFATQDRDEVIKDCHVALTNTQKHVEQVPDFVYNDLYAYLVKYVNR